MLPLQEINIRTKKGRLFAVHLEKWNENAFESKLAAINLGPTLPANATFGPFAKGATADEAFRDLISKLQNSLSNLDPDDAIECVDNPCNTELHRADQQRQALGSDVAVTVNGQDA